MIDAPGNNANVTIYIYAINKLGSFNLKNNSLNESSLFSGLISSSLFFFSGSVSSFNNLLGSSLLPWFCEFLK